MTKRPFILAIAILCAIGMKAQESYFVTTVSQTPTVVTDSTVVVTDNMSPEERFLFTNFPYRSLCDWQEGMRFMVIPEEKDAFLRTLTDSITGREIGTNDLKHKILTYRGHEYTSRGYEHLNFYCEETKRPYYMELRNISFSSYCNKIDNGGVRALAYLGDVDKARELLIGKDLFTRGNIFFQDDSSPSSPAKEVPLAEDSQVKVEAVGVGTRDFPVKIVFRAPDGNLYFQLVAMSHINCTLLPDNFYREHAKHKFVNSFAFESKTGKKSATMSAKLVGKKVNARQTVTLKNADGADQRFKGGTIFLVTDIKSISNSDYYTLHLATGGMNYTIRVTFQNKNVAGNIDGNQENYFYELFSEGTQFRANNSTIRHDRSLTGHFGGDTKGSDFAGMVSGIISKGATMQQVKMSKGAPDKTWTNRDGTVSWQYFDVTYTFRKGKVITISE